MAPVIRTANSVEIAGAKQTLALRGLPFSEAHFLRHVRSGNAETVMLYLRAGISPNARLDGETALSASANGGYFEVTRLLLEWGADPIGLTDGLKTNTGRKDHWGILSSLAGVFTFVSSLVVAGIGWYFTSTYNSRQLELNTIQAARDQQNKDYQNRLAEMQTVEKMIPHLTKDEASKRAALIAIGALATPRLAAQIAETYGGKGSIDALAQLATSGKGASAAPAVVALTNLAKVEKSGETKPAHSALASVLSGREQAIVKVALNEGSVCNGFVVDSKRGWVAIPNYCLSINSTSQPSLQFNDGSKVLVTKVIISNDGLLAFLNTGKQGVPEIALSKVRAQPGGTIIQLAFDVKRETSELGVILGKIIESGPMSFGVAGGKANVQAQGLIVALAADQRQLLGTGGAPLLDSEGNVACMTFQSARDRKNEQCLAAESIAAAMSQLPK